MLQLTTIRQQIHDLNPKEAKRMEASGEMARDLEEYQDRMLEAKREAAREAKRENKEEPAEVMIKAQELAARTAIEIVQSQIMEELTDLYREPETTE